MTPIQALIITVGSIVVLVLFGLFMNSYLKRMAAKKESQKYKAAKSLTVTYSEDGNTSITKRNAHSVPTDFNIVHDLPKPMAEKTVRKRDAKGRFMKES